MKLDPAKVTQLLHPLMEFSTDAAGKSASGEEREGSSSAEKGVDAGGDATAAAVLLRQQRLRKAAASATLVHPSLAALLCWRYCQLLTALPKRGALLEIVPTHTSASIIMPMGRCAPEKAFSIFICCPEWPKANCVQPMYHPYI